MGASFSYVIYNYNLLPDIEKQKQELQTDKADVRSATYLIQFQISKEYKLLLFSSSSLYLKLIWNIVLHTILQPSTMWRGNNSKHENPSNILNTGVRWDKPTQANLGVEG